MRAHMASKNNKLIRLRIGGRSHELKCILGSEVDSDRYVWITAMRKTRKRALEKPETKEMTGETCTREGEMEGIIGQS